MSWRFATGLLLAVAGAAPIAKAGIPPPGFEDVELVDYTSATGALDPVGIAYEPGSGALFVLEKGGGNPSGSARVRRLNRATGVVTTALTIACVDSTVERGLLGIAVDPDYLIGGTANRYVYLYYTRAVSASGGCAVSGLSAGAYNSVVRYHESGGVLSAEQLLLRGPRLVSQYHNAGSVRFGPDKTLYISMGDSGDGTSDFPRDLGDLRGKILRINRDGAIPPDNPFVGQAGARPEVWASGLRNPFRMQFDSESGNLYIADVGEQTWEELDWGVAGADYGWSCREGNVLTGECNPAPTQDVRPIYVYDHSQGSCIIGGPVYHGSNFPAEYEGAYFFGDYVGSWIKRGRFDDDGKLVDIESFMTDAGSVVDMAISPAGCLTWSGASRTVRETCYVGGTNGQPQALSSAATTAGLAPLNVQFDGTASSDPDQDPLSYSWTFGDSTTSTAAAPLKTYNTTGVRSATLTVNDGRGAANSTDAAPSIRIVVGNRPPVGNITTPAAGAHYNAGDTVTFAATANDPEDGVLPASAFAWTVIFHHATHTHPFLGPLTGVSSGSFTVPTNGEDSTDVHFQILLEVTDSGAPLGSAGKVSQKSQRDIVPNLTTITAAANPPGIGLQVSIDQVQGTAPRSLSSVVGYERTLTAPSPQTIGNATWTFVSWSDGGAAEHTLAAPAASTTYTANYQCVAGCTMMPSLSASRISTGTVRLQWTSFACASAYDIVRGDLGTLRSTAGNYTAATRACVANDRPNTLVDDSTPTSGGIWYLVRTIGCSGVGSYDENDMGDLAGPRDAEIAASGVGCP